VYRQSLRSGGKSKLIRQRTPSDESPLKPPFFDNIDPKRTLTGPLQTTRADWYPAPEPQHSDDASFGNWMFDASSVT
jgi:hypothetical protein